MKRYSGILAVVLLILCAGSTLAAPQPPLRTLHFPHDRSLGTLKDLDRLTANYSSLTWVHFPWTSEDFSQAKGNVTVPEDKRLGLVVEPQGWKDLSSLTNLAPDDIEVLGFDCDQRTLEKPGDKSVDHICALTGLKMLFLNNTDITNQGLVSLKKLKSLERLYVSSSQLDEMGIAYISELKSLKGLRLGTKKIITSKDFSHLTQLTLLEELFITGGGFEGDGLAHLSQLPSLKFLHLGGGNIGPEGLIHLGKLSSLRRLEFYDLRDEGFEALPDIPSLKELSIQRKGPEFAPLTNIARLTGLESLSLRARFTNNGLAQLKGLRALKEINLNGLRQDIDYITDEGLAHLKEIKSLDSVTINTGRFTDKGLEHLSKLKHLKKLHIPNNYGFTDAGLKHIAKLYQLESLYLRGELFTEVGLEEIAELKKLKTIKFLSPSSNARAFSFKHNRNE